MLEKAAGICILSEQVLYGPLQLKVVSTSPVQKGLLLSRIEREGSLENALNGLSLLGHERKGGRADFTPLWVSRQIWLVEIPAREIIRVPKLRPISAGMMTCGLELLYSWETMCPLNPRNVRTALLSK
jgi:hypothetical protein